MPSNANRRLPPDTLQADLDCITALKAIEGYAPSNPADTLTALNDIQTRVAAAQERELHAANAYAAARDDAVLLENERHERAKSVKNQVRAQYGNDSNEVASLGLKKASERKPTKRQGKPDGGEA